MGLAAPYEGPPSASGSDSGSPSPEDLGSDARVCSYSIILRHISYGPRNICPMILRTSPNDPTRTLADQDSDALVCP
eukprot:3422321-Rhodomonas_salina.2